MVPYTTKKAWEKEQEGNYGGFSGERGELKAPGGHAGKDAQEAI